MKLFKPYVFVGGREENDGKTYKLYEVYALSRWGEFVNRILRREKYREIKEVLRIVMGEVEEE